MRRIGLLALIGSIGVLVLAVTTTTSLATPPSGFGAPFTYRATLPAFHTDSSDYKLFQKDPQDVVMRQLTIAPGGNSGWHSHPGPVFVLITQGSVVNYHADDPTCTGQIIGAGQGYLETPGDVHMVRNEDTSTTAILLATFLDVPVGGAFRLDAPRPGNCPF